MDTFLFLDVSHTTITIDSEMNQKFKACIETFNQCYVNHDTTLGRFVVHEHLDRRGKCEILCDAPRKLGRLSSSHDDGSQDVSSSHPEHSPPSFTIKLDAVILICGISIDCFPSTCSQILLFLHWSSVISLSTESHVLYTSFFT